MDRQEKLRSIASQMSHKKALMVSQTAALFLNKSDM